MLFPLSLIFLDLNSFKPQPQLVVGLRDIGLQYSPRCDAAERGVCLEELFGLFRGITLKNGIKIQNNS